MQALRVHLPEQQMVHFEARNKRRVAESPSGKTELLAFFNTILRIQTHLLPILIFQKSLYGTLIKRSGLYDKDNLTLLVEL